MKLSKELLFNGLALLLVVAVAFGYGDFTPAPWVPTVGAFLVVIINLILSWYKDHYKK